MVFNENWYEDEQLLNLKSLAEQVKDLKGSIIEIGCWEGKSTHMLANSVYPEILICNDTWLGNQEETKVTGQQHITEQILNVRGDVYNNFIENMDNLTKKNYKIVKEDCLEWLKNYNEDIKFCHIDASHDYDSVYKTIELLKPFVVKGGILCGDDFLNANMKNVSLRGGVERAVREHFQNFKNEKNLWYWINN